VKTCSCCGRTFDAAAWAKLPLVGHQDFDEERLELRSCTCRSTLAVQVPAAPLLRELARLHHVEAHAAIGDAEATRLTAIADAIDGLADDIEVSQLAVA